MAEQALHKLSGLEDAEHSKDVAHVEPDDGSLTTFTGTGAIPPVAHDVEGGLSASEQAGYDDPGKRSAELTAKHGIRPRNYLGALDGSNTAEIILREVMPHITTWMNERARVQKLDTRFTVAELTTNFLAEGGILALKANATTGLDGFQVAGVDTFMDRYAELKPWLHPCIEKDKVSAAGATANEKGEMVRSITDLTLVQAAWANATMYAAGKARLEKWLRRRNKNIDTLDTTDQFYWATTYYNAGEGHAEKKLASDGVASAKKKWTGGDDWERYYTNATFNAKMRTSTFELTRDEAMTDDTFKAIPADVQSNVGMEVASEIEFRRDELRELIKAITRGDSPERVAMYKRQLAQLGQQLEILESAQQNQLAGPEEASDGNTSG